MEEILFVDACVRGERSRTLALARRFLEAYHTRHPESVVKRRSLCENRLSPQYPEVLAQRDELWNAGQLDHEIFAPARQFAAADKIVIAAPFWDLSFPAILKIYLERISVCDITFGYDEVGRSSPPGAGISPGRAPPGWRWVQNSWKPCAPCTASGNFSAWPPRGWTT